MVASRLLINQMRRGGVANTVALIVLTVICLMAAVGMFIAAALVGLFAFSKSYPDVILYVWDGLVVAFLFAWTIGLMIELQRSEVLALEKLLHLPISLRGAF